MTSFCNFKNPYSAVKLSNSKYISINHVEELVKLNLLSKQAVILSLFSIVGFACTHSTNSAPVDPTDCSPAQSTDPGIIGGQSIDEQSWLGRSVAILIGQSKQGYYSCSVTFIDQNIILTAAHCVTEENSPTLIANDKIKIGFTSNLLCMHKQGKAIMVADVDKIAVNPHWQQAFDDRGDLAIIRISGVIPNNYLTVDLPAAPLAFQPGVRALIAGYGNQKSYSDQESSMRLEYTDVQPLADQRLLKILAQQQTGSGDAQMLSFMSGKFNNSSTSEYYTIDQRNLHGACAGDSGGPLMINSNGKFYEVGVASFVDNLNDTANQEPCDELSMYSSVSYYHDWIESTFQSFKTGDSLKSSPFIATTGGH